MELVVLSFFTCGLGLLLGQEIGNLLGIYNSMVIPCGIIGFLIPSILTLQKMNDKNKKLEEKVDRISIISESLYGELIEEKGLDVILIKMLNRKLGKLSDEYVNRIKNASQVRLVYISENLNKIRKIEDLDRYLKKLN